MGKIPNPIPDDILATITKVVDIQAPHYRIAGYEKEDVKQEAYIICMQALDSWDKIRPLENFLSVHLSNRLKTLVRDHHKLQGRYAENTQKILRPLDIDSVNWDNEKALSTYNDEIYEGLILKEMEAAIDNKLPISLRKDYLKMRAGLKINQGRARKIREFLSEFFGDY